MPIKHIGTDMLPIVYDDDYVVADEDKLVKFIGDILLGRFFYIKRIIDNLDDRKGPNIKDEKDAAIQKLNSTNISHLKGLLFQHLSWIALATQYGTSNLKMIKPHDEPIEHGLDGFAILLNNDGSINKIIITEDKCSDDPRNRITQEVFPEYDQIEKGIKDNIIISNITSLVGENPSYFDKIEPNIANKQLWQYRIGITRDSKHDAIENRRDLFKDYEKHVADPQERRHAATILIPDTKAWATDLRDKIIDYIKSR